MTLAFICGTEPLGGDQDGVRALHARFPVARHRYARVGEWSGLGADVLLRGGEGADAATRRRARRISLATAMLAVHDVLAVHGIRPQVVGGTGTGALVAAALARCLSAQDLIGSLLRPGPDAAAGGDRAARPEVALAFLPPAHDPDWYLHAREGGAVRDVGGLGLDEDSGRHRVVLLSGTGEELARLASVAPRGAIRARRGADPLVPVPPAGPAPHDTWSPVLNAPTLPLCSPRGPVTTADAAGQLFAADAGLRVDLGDLAQCLDAHGTRLGLVLGSSLPRNLVRFPFPVVHVESPDDLGEAVSAIFEFGAAPRAIA
ncbi:hypothetical protein POF50_005025 [Streptomyces sp. SL13]|uniref:ACP S-malonyltransferase n=1 Tax=Streptantibioticus silvisoli TaxID=2705255 RepID=A0AA90KFB4_9ACTN|nr:hypothetical protein [Streptantibioticus silvisoli]MDI5962999.1 hypothetical protein [Streptantibioticus silvisoli]MDI5968714.1 hypothetical protein [Streptantibioticus silvisoli]